MISALTPKHRILLVLAAAAAIALASHAALTSASTHVIESLSADSGFCVDDGANHTVRVGNSPTADQVIHSYSDDPDLLGTELTIPCGAPQAGKSVTITLNGTTTPLVTVNPVSLRVTIGGDSDSIVLPGIELDVFVELTHPENAPAPLSDSTDDSQNFAWVTVSSGAVYIDSDDLTRGGELGVDALATGSLIVPSTVPDGTYTLFVRFQLGDTDNTTYDGQASITVGDAGKNAAAATLALGVETYDNPLTGVDETTLEDGEEPAADGDIWLELTVTNSLGNNANSSGLSSVSVIGAGGSYAIHGATSEGRPNADALAGGTGVNSAQVTNPDDAKSTMFVKVEKTDRQSGNVSVYAVVVGTDGSPTSNTIDLTFTDDTPIDPQPEPALDNRLSVGQYHACAIDEDDTLHCWGNNWFGQTDVPEPTTSYVAVSAGGYHTCAIEEGGAIRCWGANHYGQLNAPRAVGGFSAVSAGEAFTCAIRSEDDRLVCWGDNENGQATVPDADARYSSVAAGLYHGCAIRSSSGQVECWGGKGGYDDGQVTVPDPSVSYSGLSAGFYHTCAIRSDNDNVECWGNNYYGQTDVTDPVAAYSSVGAGYNHACAVRSDDGTVECWGDTQFNQQSAPTGGHHLVDAGGDFSCAVKNDGSLSCWGRNQYGQTTPPQGISMLVP